MPFCVLGPSTRVRLCCAWLPFDDQVPFVSKHVELANTEAWLALQVRRKDCGGTCPRSTTSQCPLQQSLVCSVRRAGAYSCQIGKLRLCAGPCGIPNSGCLRNSWVVAQGAKGTDQHSPPCHSKSLAHGGGAKCSYGAEFMGEVLDDGVSTHHRPQGSTNTSLVLQRLQLHPG